MSWASRVGWLIFIVALIGNLIPHADPPFVVELKRAGLYGIICTVMWTTIVVLAVRCVWLMHRGVQMHLELEQRKLRNDELAATIRRAWQERRL